MRIRSGQIIVLVGALICAAVVAIVVLGGGTEAAPNDTVDPSATIPSADTDPALVPHMEIETNEKDMGVVSNTEHTKKPYRIKNTGKADLIIREVRTSCACTVAVLPKQGLVIPPGGDATFDIEIDPFRIPGFEARRVLTIYSNDLSSPQIEVGVTSHVDPEFSIEPAEADFGDVMKGSTTKVTLVLRQIGDAPLEVTGIDTFGHTKKDSKEGIEAAAAAANFDLSFVKRPESAWAKPGKAEFEVSIALTPEMPAGPLSGKHVYLLTNIKRLAAMPITLKGKVIAPYTLSPVPPIKLNIKGNAATGTYEYAYAVVTADGPVTLENVTPKGTNVIASAEAGSTPNEAKIKVTINPSAPAGPIEEDIEFTVSTSAGKFPDRVGVRSFGIGKATPAK